MTNNYIRLIDLPVIENTAGNLSFLQNNDQIPFNIKRTYWIYDVPGGQYRQGHAFKNQQEFIIALSGSFDVNIHNGKEEQVFHLNRSYYGLYLANNIWRSMGNFSTNALALILSDQVFNEDDYIRDFNIFRELHEK